jgi:hypothetical protein
VKDRATIDTALSDVMGNILDHAALSPWHNLCLVREWKQADGVCRKITQIRLSLMLFP